MRELKIVFTKSKKKIALFSRLLRWWTRKPYSHVAREVIRQDWGAGYYQASEGHVNYEHESVFHKKHEIVKSYTLMVDDHYEMSVRKACWEDCGKDYGVWQNVGIFLVDIGLLRDTPWKDGRNCSELIYLKVFHDLLPLNYNPDTIKPHHLEDIILEYFVERDGKWYLATELPLDSGSET